MGSVLIWSRLERRSKSKRHGKMWARGTFLQSAWLWFPCHLVYTLANPRDANGMDELASGFEIETIFSFSHLSRERAVNGLGAC